MKHKVLIGPRFLNALLLVVVLITLLSSPTVSEAVDDSFIKGYAAAVLERELNLAYVSLDVENGIITLRTEELQYTDIDRIITALSDIQGVVDVKILEPERRKTGGVFAFDKQSPVKPLMKGSLETEGLAQKLFSYKYERLFPPLIADPRWPNFSSAYQYYIDDGGLESVFAGSIGDMIPLYTGDIPFAFGGKWQVGGEAGAFVIHDLNTSSLDQVNANYMFGLTAAYRNNSLSGIFRIFHQSSHIGDEFLLNNDVKRENYSYEALGLLVSKEPMEWLRIYGGGEYHFSRSPKELEPWVLQYGFEMASPTAYARGLLRPAAAADFKHKEDNDWSGAISLKAGLRIETEQLSYHRLLLMLGYFNGHSPNGQFRKQSIEYTSIGFQFNY